MKLVPDTTTLVIAGAWNPAILSPDWVATKALGKSQGEVFQVSMQMPVNVGGVFQVQRATFEGISMSTSFEALTFYLDAVGDDPDRAISASRAILQELPHTPISGLGINFAYTLDSPDEDVLGEIDASSPSFEILGEAASVKQKVWQAVVAVPDHIVNVSCTRAGSFSRVDINHHYEVSNADRARNILETQGLFVRLKEISELFVKSLEKEEVNGERS